VSITLYLLGGTSYVTQFVAETSTSRFLESCAFRLFLSAEYQHYV